MNVHTVVLLGTLAFAGGASLVPLLRHFVHGASESHKTLSDGLSGPWHWMEDAGFSALAAALTILGIALASPVSWLCWLTAAGIVGAMVTDSFGVGGKDREKIHLVSAGVAFVGALALEAALAHGWILWTLFALYPVSVGAMYLAWPKYTAWQEKTAALAIVAFFIGWGLG